MGVENAVVVATTNRLSSSKGLEQTNDNKWFHLRMTRIKYNRLM